MAKPTTVDPDALTALIERVQDCAEDARAFRKIVESNPRHASENDPHALRSAASLLSASLSLAETARILLTGPSFLEISRELETKLKAELNQGA